MCIGKLPICIGACRSNYSYQAFPDLVDHFQKLKLALIALALHKVNQFRRGNPPPLFSDGLQINRTADIKDLEQVNNPGMIDPEVRFIFRIIMIITIIK